MSVLAYNSRGRMLSVSSRFILADILSVLDLFDHGSITIIVLRILSTMLSDWWIVISSTITHPLIADSSATIQLIVNFLS